MDSLLTQVIAWPTLLASLLMFGFAPGAVLRVIVLAYKRDDLRRTELLAELPYVPRVERPFWVCEQLEVAMFEGLAGRVAALVSRKRKGRRRSARELDRTHTQPDDGRITRSGLPRDVWRAVLGLGLDGGNCAACGVIPIPGGLEFDHMVPVARNGTGTVENLQLLCADCNQRKGQRLPFKY